MVALSKFFPPLVLEIQLKLSFILLMLGLVNILVPERVDGDREALLCILRLLPLPESGKFKWRIRFKTLCYPTRQSPMIFAFGYQFSVYSLWWVSAHLA